MSPLEPVDDLQSKATKSRDAKGEISKTVERAIRLLQAYDDQHLERGVSELSRELAMPKAIVQRLVNTLEHHSFLERNPDTKRYRIGISAFRTGLLFRADQNLDRVALPLMQQLVAETGQTCNMSVLREGLIVVIQSVEGRGPLKYSAAPGSTRFAHASASGKAALSALSNEEVGAILDQHGMPSLTPNTLSTRDGLFRELDAVRKRRFAMNWEETYPGLGAIATPIVNHEGRLIAVLGMGFSTASISKMDAADFCNSLIQTADNIVQRMWG